MAQLSTTTTQRASANGGGKTQAEALRYAQCMRSHGIADFPDPSASGAFSIHGAGSSSDLNRDNPTFQAADRSCRRYSPQQNVTPAQHAALERVYVRFARCMRSHGVGDFPDPVTGSGGSVGFYFRGGSNDLDSNNPAFRQGVESCQRILGHQFRFVFTPGGRGKGA